MTLVLAIGDVVGRAGRQALQSVLPRIRKLYTPDIVIMNGENAAGGFGLTEALYNDFIQEFGIDCITMGNHWHDKHEIFEFRSRASRLVLPANMANVESESDGLKVLKSHSGHPFAVINLSGKAFMHDGNRNPFEAAARLISQIPSSVTVRIVDMHAEATSEKQGIGHFLTGKASLVYGTHSHVPTADERIFRDHTGFITDIGATAAYDSIIGMVTESALRRLMSGQKRDRLEPAEGDPWFCGILAEVDDTSGRCLKMERLQWRLKHMDLSKDF